MTSILGTEYIFGVHKGVLITNPLSVLSQVDCRGNFSFATKLGEQGNTDELAVQAHGQLFFDGNEQFATNRGADHIEFREVRLGKQHITPLKQSSRKAFGTQKHF